MSTNKILKYALIHALGAAVYVALVAALMSNAGALFDKVDNKLVGTATFLLLFVISAAIVGVLVFGRPVMWYLDGVKKEAVQLVIATISFLVILTSVVLIFLAVW